MLENITESLLNLLDTIGYLGIFIASAIESFFAPIPSEIILITAGFYADSQGNFLLVILISAVAALGSFVGTLPFYLLAKYSADTFLPKFLKRWGIYLLITHNDLEKSQRLFDKKGPIIVFIARLIPGIRSLVAFPAGASNMSNLKYFLFTFLGSFIWNIVLTSIGFEAYEYKDQIFEFLKPIEKFIVYGLVVAIIAYVFSVMYQIKKYKKIDEIETD